MIRQHPGYTLFPATPHFRLLCAEVALQPRQHAFHSVPEGIALGDRWLGKAHLQVTQNHHAFPDDSTVFCLDRKSTRLNSSHANISYAVFCLKKKTTLWSPVL